MLKKLLKYDLRANMKIFLLIWPAMLLFTGLQRLLLCLKETGRMSEFLAASLTGIVILGLFAAVILCFVVCVIRFYSGLLRREGYLMFTLPVKPWQLLLSKLLSAMLTLAITAILAYVCSAIVLSGLDACVWDTMFNFSRILDQPLHAWTLVLAALCLLATLANTILRVYFVSCLGHLCRRARIFFSILFYYLIGILTQILITIASLLLTSVNTPIWLFRLGALMGGMSFNQVACLMLGSFLLCGIVIGCVYFFVSEVILRKRLNLE